jgi:hypothetical protein
VAAQLVARARRQRRDVGVEEGHFLLRGVVGADGRTEDGRESGAHDL